MTDNTNRLRRTLDAGGRAIGVTIQMASPEIVEIASGLGYDFAFVDAEHGIFDLPLLANMFRAAGAGGLSTIVRVPDHTPSYIGRVLDAGADGVVVPHIRTAADAHAAVLNAHYGPAGRRGACPATRATAHSVRTWSAYRAQADRDVHVWALVEDIEGVDNIEAIVAVPGLDAVMFGPFDLAQALGHDGDVHHPEVAELRRRVQCATDAAGVQLVASVLWEEPGGPAGARARDARILLAGVDRAGLAAQWREQLADLRAVNA